MPLPEKFSCWMSSWRLSVAVDIVRDSMTPCHPHIRMMLLWRVANICVCLCLCILGPQNDSIRLCDGERSISLQIYLYEVVAQWNSSAISISSEQLVTHFCHHSPLDRRNSKLNFDFCVCARATLSYPPLSQSLICWRNRRILSHYGNIITTWSPQIRLGPIWIDDSDDDAIVGLGILRNYIQFVLDSD